MDRKTESTEAGKTPGIGIKTVQGQDSEGHISGSKQEEFSERRAQEDQQREDEADLNKTDARDKVQGTESV
ncbi:MAG TPA: hypothetical protein VER36_10350 [Flavisolibacter sp.]|nr:hypothetical protein [Flavisolibacter sp.]